MGCRFEWPQFRAAAIAFMDQNEKTNEILSASEVFKKCAPTETNSFLSMYFDYVNVLVQNLKKLLEEVDSLFATGTIQYDGTPIIVFETVVTRLFASLLSEQNRLETECKAFSFLLTPLREVVKMLGKEENPEEEQSEITGRHIIEGITVLRHKDIERIEASLYLYRQDEGISLMKSKITATKSQTKRLAASFSKSPKQLDILKTMEAKSIQKFEDDIYFHRAPVPYKLLCDKWELEKKRTVENNGVRPPSSRFVASLPPAPLAGGPIKAGFEIYTASYISPRGSPKTVASLPSTASRPVRSGPLDWIPETPAPRVFPKTPQPTVNTPKPQPKPAPHTLPVRKIPIPRAQTRTVRPLPPQRTPAPSSSSPEVVRTPPRRVRPMAVISRTPLPLPSSMKPGLPTPGYAMSPQLIRKRPVRAPPTRKIESSTMQEHIALTVTKILSKHSSGSPIPAKRFREELPAETPAEKPKTQEPEPKVFEDVRSVPSFEPTPESKASEEVPETSVHQEAAEPRVSEEVPEASVSAVQNPLFEEQPQVNLFDRYESQSPELPTGITAAQFLRDFLGTLGYNADENPMPVESSGQNEKMEVVEDTGGHVEDRAAIDAAERERAEQKRRDDLRHAEDLRALGFFDQPNSDFLDDSIIPSEDADLLEDAPEELRPYDDLVASGAAETSDAHRAPVKSSQNHQSSLLLQLLTSPTPESSMRTPIQSLEDVGMPPKTASSEYSQQSMETCQFPPSEVLGLVDSSMQQLDESESMEGVEEVPNSLEVMREAVAETEAIQMEEQEPFGDFAVEQKRDEMTISDEIWKDQVEDRVVKEHMLEKEEPEEVHGQDDPGPVEEENTLERVLESPTYFEAPEEKNEQPEAAIVSSEEAMRCRSEQSEIPIASDTLGSLFTGEDIVTTLIPQESELKLQEPSTSILDVIPRIHENSKEYDALSIKQDDFYPKIPSKTESIEKHEDTPEKPLAADSSDHISTSPDVPS